MITLSGDSLEKVRTWSWSSSCTVAGEQRKVVPSKLCQQEVKPSRSKVHGHRERVPGSSVGY